MSARSIGKRTPPNTMNLRPFVYLRIPDVATGGTWQQPTATEGTWGNIILPQSAISLKCMKDEGLIELQSTYAAESVRTYIFEPFAQVIVLGNSLIYFDDHFKNSVKGNIEDYLNQEKTSKKQSRR